MFTAREKFSLSHLAVSQHFPSPCPPLRGQQAASRCPCPFTTHPLCHDCQESVPIVWDGDACQLGIELKLPYASEQLSDGNDFLPLVLIQPATERDCIVMSFWSYPTPAEVTLPFPQQLVFNGKRGALSSTYSTHAILYLLTLSQQSLVQQS